MTSFLRVVPPRFAQNWSEEQSTRAESRAKRNFCQTLVKLELSEKVNQEDRRKGTTAAETKCSERNWRNPGSTLSPELGTTHVAFALLDPE
jgi:hypothetical protein